LKHQTPDIRVLKLDRQLALLLHLVERPPVTKFCCYFLKGISGR